MRICCYALMMVLAGVIVFAGVMLAHGHVSPSGWEYPEACCAGSHCRPVSCTTVTTHADGSVDWTGLHFIKDQVHPSKDGECHVCLGYLQTGLRQPYCAFVAGTM